MVSGQNSKETLVYQIKCAEFCRPGQEEKLLSYCSTSRPLLQLPNAVSQNAEMIAHFSRLLGDLFNSSRNQVLLGMTKAHCLLQFQLDEESQANIHIHARRVRNDSLSLELAPQIDLHVQLWQFTFLYSFDIIPERGIMRCSG